MGTVAHKARCTVCSNACRTDITFTALLSEHPSGMAWHSRYGISFATETTQVGCQHPVEFFLFSLPERRLHTDRGEIQSCFCTLKVRTHLSHYIRSRKKQQSDAHCRQSVYRAPQNLGCLHLSWGAGLSRNINQIENSDDQSRTI